MNIYIDAVVETLGESRKSSRRYTKYDYIELSIDEKLIQIPSVLVHDVVNAGLIAGMKAEFFFADYYLYSSLSQAFLVTECVALKTKTSERSHYANLIDQIKKRPTLPGLLSWTLLMPIRALRSSNGGSNPISAMILLFWVVMSTPIIAPLTYYKRRERYRELMSSLNGLSESNFGKSSIQLPSELISSVA